MLRLDDHAYALGVDGSHEGGGDLLRQPLLHLEPTRVAVHQTGQLAHAVHLVPGDVPDVALAEEGEHVVLAHAVEFDVPHNDHMVALFLEDRAPQDRGGVLLVALHEIIVCLFHARRGLDEPFAVAVFADGGEDPSNRFSMDLPFDSAAVAESLRSLSKIYFSGQRGECHAIRIR